MTMTREQVAALLDGTTEGPWSADGDPQNRIVWSSDDNRVCFMAHSGGLNDDRDIATSNLVAAAPDLARQLLAAMDRLADADMAQAVLVEQCADEFAVHPAINAHFYADTPDQWRWRVYEHILSLAPDTGVKALAELRKRAEKAELDGTTAWALLKVANDNTAAAIAERDDLRARLAEAEGQVKALRIRHVKRGSTYRVLGRGQLQTDTPLTDYADVVIYQCEDDGRIWIRPVAEFDDGRFVALAAAEEPKP